MPRKLLIISDDPERASFNQITNLKRLIEASCRKRADLIAITNDKVFLGKKCLGSALDANRIVTLIQDIVEQGIYDAVMVSLTTDNLRRVFLSHGNILKRLRRTNPDVPVFVFGARRILNEIRQDQELKSLSLFNRTGVSKYSREFIEAVMKVCANQREPKSQLYS